MSSEGWARQRQQYTALSRDAALSSSSVMGITIAPESSDRNAAGVDAGVDGVIGGVKGAILGAVTGVGGAIAATEGNDIHPPAGSIIRIRLDLSVDVA